jgi:hypothetical protein
VLSPVVLTWVVTSDDSDRVARDIVPVEPLRTSVHECFDLA